MRHISKRNGHSKLRSLSQDTLDVDRTVMLQYNAFSNRETKAGPADFS